MSYFRQSSRQDAVFHELLRQVLTEKPYTGVPTEPSRLLPHVYIGNQNNAESLRLLRRLKITHVLNCAGYKGPRPKPNASPYEGLGIDYHEFKAEDIDSYDIRRHFGEAFSYLQRVKREGGICLVHCALGINRSGATCLAYMMAHDKTPLLQTARIIKRKRRIVLSNKGFQRQLIAWARTKGLLDENVDESSISLSSQTDGSASRGDTSPVESMAASFLDRSRELRRNFATPTRSASTEQYDQGTRSKYSDASTTGYRSYRQ